MSIRIVRIIDRLNIGGPTKHVTWLTAGLASEGFETTLITGTVPSHEGDMSWFAAQAGITPLVVKEMSREIGLRDALVVIKLWRLFCQLKPQIVHTHKAKAGAVGRLAAWLYRWLTWSILWGKPNPCYVVHTFHGHIFHGYYGKAKSRLFMLIESLLARWFTHRIITISQQQRHEINETYGIGAREQFRVIPLGIDCHEQHLPASQLSLREEYQLAENELAVGIVGRLCTVKNHALFLQAVARLQTLAPALAARTRFFVIGDGELRDALEAQAQELNVKRCVTFTGFRKEVGGLYRELDLVVLSSINEGTPLTLIEAMNSGCAVMATAVGGVVDILGQRREARDGLQLWDYGVTVQTRDQEAFARGLLYLLTEASEREAMGKLGQQFVQQTLSRERLLEDIARLYQELLPEQATSA